MVECLERLRGRMQPPPAVRGDAAWLQEQLRENSLQLAELEKLGVALETLRGQGAELLATMQTSANEGMHHNTSPGVQSPEPGAQPSPSPPLRLPLSGAEGGGWARGQEAFRWCSGQTVSPSPFLLLGTEIWGRVEQLLRQWQEMWAQSEERERWLRGLLALADRFWHSLADLAVTLSDTQQAVLEEHEATSDPAAIRARLEAMQALREEIDAVQSELDSLGSLGVELMASCGDLEKPDVTKSLDDLYLHWHSVSKVWTERQTQLEEQLKASLAYQEAMEHQLEAALLGLGQFQNQLEELLQWLLHTTEQLAAGPTAFPLDLQSCEIELAKHKQVLRNDVLSHTHTVQSVQEAGQGLLLSSGAEAEGGLQSRLQQLSQRWDLILHEIESHQQQLESNLSQVNWDPANS
ncbi:hypothetical protein JD844_015332 [Phrynosoma platyrhinos]|uniref:Uncharacterized protein n=1 Tax=Phrynosoma platyrhinos TaxID=52577 RepID=A0ABQ7SIY1_PHRPL|nr:hypothetical protein JD844_015332 [Phrynosoma platyrhinos]